jgi:hypothetical protein
MFILFQVILILAVTLPLVLTTVNMKKRGASPDEIRSSRKLLILKVIFGVIVGAVIVWNVYLSIFVNVQWFTEKGYEEVFLRSLREKWILFGVGFVISLVFLIINLDITFRTVWGKPKRALITWIFSLGFALLHGLSMSYLWNVRLLHSNQVVSELIDPVFGKSISYYLFSLPWKIGIISMVFSLVVITFLIILGAFISRVIYEQVKKKKKKRVESRSFKAVIIQLFILGAIWAFLYVFRMGLNIDELVYSRSGVVVGAGYTDLHAKLFGLRLSRVVWLLVTILLAVSAVPKVREKLYFTSKGKPAKGRIIGIPLGAIALLILLTVILPGLQQATRVAPDELKAEMPYIEHNMAFTREAYAIGPDHIEEKEIEIGREIGSEVFESNRATIENIRFWDYRALKDYLREHQEIKPYYEFYDVDVDRYYLDGEIREVMLAVREMETEQLDQRALTWLNRTFKYTHGYGITVAPVNEFLAGGKPNLIVKNIPAEESYTELALKTPQVYYGELTTSNILTTPKVDEFDYPAGEENAYNNYDGDGGFYLDSSWKKFCIAWHLNAHQILFSPYVDAQTRVHLNRNITAMLGKIAPWLKYDKDPYPVISEGRIKWIQDAFTTSGNYPYSEVFTGEPYYGINYIRNAVKVVIDAYDGNASFYLFDEKDPIIGTYQKIFPTLFKTAGDIPADLKAHLRYPEDLFTIQLEMYGTYQMKNTQVFYTKEDVWERPKEKYHQEDDILVEPYYITALLPEEAGPEFILMSPYTPWGKNVLRSWICARSDGENYGRLIVFRFPKGEEIKGPRMIESRIDQDSDISQVLTLWDQKGSQVLRGNLMVIPLFFGGKAYLLYVEPVYLQAEGAKMPEIKKIVLADQETIVWGDSFGESMEALSGMVRLAAAETAESAAAVLESIDRGDLSAALSTLAEMLSRYKTLQGEGRFREAGAELEKVYTFVEQLAGRAGSAGGE